MSEVQQYLSYNFCLILSRYPEQVSHTIALENGKRYYLEAINKQDSDTDNNLSVGVELPDGKKMFPISEMFLRRSKIDESKFSFFLTVHLISEWLQYLIILNIIFILTIYFTFEVFNRA